MLKVLQFGNNQTGCLVVSGSKVVHPLKADLLDSIQWKFKLCCHKISDQCFWIIGCIAREYYSACLLFECPILFFLSALFSLMIESIFLLSALTGTLNVVVRLL